MSKMKIPGTVTVCGETIYPRVIKNGRHGYAVEFPGGFTSPMPSEDVAALFAAAPKLLEAMSEFMEFSDNGTPIHPGSLAVANARTAVAAALRKPNEQPEESSKTRMTALEAGLRSQLARLEGEFFSQHEELLKAAGQHNIVKLSREISSLDSRIDEVRHRLDDVEILTAQLRNGIWAEEEHQHHG